jgi:uncharacterized protein YkwD
MNKHGYAKWIASLIVLLLLISLVVAIPIISPPSVSTPGTLPGSDKIPIGYSGRPVVAVGPYVPDFLKNESSGEIWSNIEGFEQGILGELSNLDISVQSFDLLTNNKDSIDEFFEPEDISGDSFSGTIETSERETESYIYTGAGERETDSYKRIGSATSNYLNWAQQKSAHVELTYTGASNVLHAIQLLSDYPSFELRVWQYLNGQWQYLGKANNAPTTTDKWGSWYPVPYRKYAFQAVWLSGTSAPGRIQFNLYKWEVPSSPTITSVSPNSAPNTGNVQVTIRGTNFKSGMIAGLVRSGYSAILATNVVLVSSTELRCTLPISGKATGQWTVAVKNNDGSNQANFNNGFTITSSTPGNPTITSVSPNSAPNTGNVQVTIRGTNFKSGIIAGLVRSGYSTIMATNVVLVSSTELRCTLPISGKATGQWTVAVKNNDGSNQANLNNGFTITSSTPTDQQQIINGHQTWRSLVGSPSLTWSSTLATQAQRWAQYLKTNGLVWQQSPHSPKDGYYRGATDGENLGMGWSSGANTYTYANAISSWGEEKGCYNHGPFGCARDSCGGCTSSGGWVNMNNIGHYTQVVWKNTQQIGCALATGVPYHNYPNVDARTNWNVVVCQYSPGGNIEGQYAY